MTLLQKLLGPITASERGLFAVSAASCFKNGAPLSRDGNTYLVRRGDRQIRLSRQHLVYAIGVAQHFETYFSQVEPIQRDRFLEANYSGPQLHTLHNGLQFEIASMPEEASALDAYFRFYRPGPGELVFDVGAYCGISAYAFSHAVGPEGRVIAFEPDPLNVELLRRNIERHKLSNVAVAQVALSDSNGTATFNSEGSTGSALSTVLDRPPTNATASVRTATFEQACAEFGIPSFVKIDAEGAEIEIISGSQDFLRSHPIHLVLDTDHIRDGKTTHSAVEGMLNRCGYKTVSELDTGGFMTTWATPNSKKGDNE
ncbi:MAG: FkbM family methyltransferase [Acidobacteria bacterium]|nr:FkbM family methyltransferase [Acidobacteriota bacterium]